MVQPSNHKLIENLQEIQGDEPLKEGAYYYTQPTERVKSTKNVAVKFCIKKYGYYRVGDTPVPIPNTEVKPCIADDTWRAASWESRS